MYRVFAILILSILMNVWYTNGLTNDSDELPHSMYAIAGNEQIPLDDDCALRAFTIEMAAYIAPTSSKTKWKALSESAFQMDQCNMTSYNRNQGSSFAKLFKTAPAIQRGVCQQTVFVHDIIGDDLFDGTFQKPKRTIQSALSLTRSLHYIHGSDKTLCMTIRGGTYYLGTNATTTSSQIGAIALTSNDSNLVIENYPGETVILSGGTLLQLEWSIHTKTPNGTIMKAQVPNSVNLDEFNELYIDGKRAIVAKYPNGDPSTEGLFVKNPGYASVAERWIPPIHIPSVNIFVESPNRNSTGLSFPNYQIGLGGGASVFNPPRSFWSTDSPPAGANYAVPGGFVAKNGSLLHLSNWSNPSTGFVHTFHGGFWGGWTFQIGSINSTNNTIMFSRGGFQEARGWNTGGPLYISNIFEELDSPNEWFLDKNTRTLYFMPNDTMPKVFVASQIACIISVTGSEIENNANNILIQGLTFTETSNTYMKDYMVPSGGDWSVHPGGTIFLENTRNITITNNTFIELGSIGVAIINHNNGTMITLNEFVWLGDSAIVNVGTTNGIDGFTVPSQPTNTVIESNLIHEIGVYVKQSAAVLISVSRSISVISNLIFNIPRAGININDGFYGNHTISWNVIFNTVRETKDHGTINSWDRQPFLTDAVQPGVPSLWQHVTYIHHNTLINNYHSSWPIDHDDGSCLYEDSYNFQVYGGKKNLMGHSKTDHHEIYVYPDSGGSGCIKVYGSTHIISSPNETWVDNICALYQTSIPYKIDNCNKSNFVPYLANNTIYIPSGTEATFSCVVNGTFKHMNLQEWQSYGFDIGSVVETTPSVKTMIEWGRQMLQNTTQTD